MPRVILIRDHHIYPATRDIYDVCATCWGDGRHEALFAPHMPPCEVELYAFHEAYDDKSLCCFCNHKLTIQDI